MGFLGWDFHYDFPGNTFFEPILVENPMNSSAVTYKYVSKRLDPLAPYFLIWLEATEREGRGQGVMDGWTIAPLQTPDAHSSLISKYW